MTGNIETIPFSVIAKPVGSRCNMNCAYCYYLDKGKYSQHVKQSRMNFSLLEKLIRQTIEANPGPVVSFTWHGGEPTLAGIEFFQRVVEIEKKYLPKGWEVWNNLQTNGLLLNDEWCKFLRNNHFDVGISIDGNRLTHDKNRKDKGGNTTYNRVKKSIQRLLTYGIQPDLLCTVTSVSLDDPLDIYRALRALDTGWIQFIPVIVPMPNGGIDPISISPKGYGQFLCTVFDEWICHDLGLVDVQLFAETAKVWAGGTAGVCHMAPTCGQVIVVEEDGSIYSCDHFVDNEHRLGNLLSNRIDKTVNSIQQQNFGNSKKNSLTQECLACPWLSCCNGGCPKDRFGMSSDGENGQYYLCQGLKDFFSHADAPLHAAMSLSREGKSTQEIMSFIREMLC